MLRTLKSESEQTLPHFCSFLAFRALPKSSQNRLQKSVPLISFKKWYKNRHFSNFKPSGLPNWLQHGSPKLPQNRPKTVQIVYKSVAAYKTLPKCPETSKKLQKAAKIFKNGQKSGSVCSDSLCRVRNIRSISDAFWARFWEGLGSILGGFSVPRAKKWRSRAV